MFWCGSATLVRRTALEEVGGVLTATVAEDFHTTIALHARGWRTHYHHEVLVQGLAPHDLAGFLLQRARWARGQPRGLPNQREPGDLPRSHASAACELSGLALELLLGAPAPRAPGRPDMDARLRGAADVTRRCSRSCASGFHGRCSRSRRAARSGAARSGHSTPRVYGIMTIGIYLRGILAVFSRRTGAFKVTPKEGLDEGGFRVLRMLGLVTTMSCLLLAAWVFRLAAAFGIVQATAMPTFALVITIALGSLGAWVHRARDGLARSSPPTASPVPVPGEVVGPRRLDVDHRRAAGPDAERGRLRVRGADGPWPHDRAIDPYPGLGCPARRYDHPSPDQVVPSRLARRLLPDWWNDRGTG